MASPRLRVVEPSRASLEAVTALYARAVNRLDASVVDWLLAADVECHSQATGVTLSGRDSVAGSLARQLEAARRAERLRAEVGRVDLPRSPDHPCVLVHQGGIPACTVVLRLDVRCRVVRIDVLTTSPPPSAVRGGGVFPG